MINKIKQRFDQRTLNHFTSIEELIISAAKGDDFTIDDSFKQKLDGDIDKLSSELKLLPAIVKEVLPSLMTSSH